MPMPMPMPILMPILMPTPRSRSRLVAQSSSLLRLRRLPVDRNPRAHADTLSLRPRLLRPPPPRWAGPGSDWRGHHRRHPYRQTSATKRRRLAGSLSPFDASAAPRAAPTASTTTTATTATTAAIVAAATTVQLQQDALHRRTKTKRPPSAYQIFLREYVAAGARARAQCRHRYRRYRCRCCCLHARPHHVTPAAAVGARSCRPASPVSTPSRSWVAAGCS